MFAGGIETGSLTEAFGEFRTGKTQLGHTLAVTCQLDEASGGAKGKALVIDTEGVFRPERCIPIAERFGLDPDAVLENISYVRAYTSDQQVEVMTEAAAMIADGWYKLIIIDSITSLFRTDYMYTGRGELADRQQKLNKCGSEFSAPAGSDRSDTAGATSV